MRRDDPFKRELDKINIEDSVLDKARAELKKKAPPKFKWRPAYTVAIVVCCLIAIMAPIIMMNRMPSKTPDTSKPNDSGGICTIEDVNSNIDALAFKTTLSIEYLEYKATQIPRETAGSVYPYYYSVTLLLQDNESIVISIDKDIEDNLLQEVQLDDTMIIKGNAYKYAMTDEGELHAVSTIGQEKVYIFYRGKASNILERISYIIDEMTI